MSQLANSGAIRDLTGLMGKYACNDDMNIWKSNGSIPLKQATINGKIYGLPSGISDTDYYSYLWIRSDWMDALGLSYPKTIDELTGVIKAFYNADLDGDGQKNTTGIVVDKTLFPTVRGLFSAFDAYPEVWVKKDGGGGLQWGGVSDSNKQALACLTDWYKKGFINPEFITQDNATAMKSAISGKCGILYGGHWLVQSFEDLHKADPKSNWHCIKLPTGTGKPVKSPLIANSSGWMVVNSHFDHPEVAFKLHSLTGYAYNDKNSAWWLYESNSTWQINPTRGNVSGMDNLNTYLNLMEAYDHNNDTSLLKGKAVPYWNNLHGTHQWAWQAMFGRVKTPQ